MKLMSTVFHEVRNPLGLINLHAELIKKNPQNAAISAEIISRASRDLERTLTEFLEVSKPLTVEKAQGYLAQNISELVSMFRPSYEEKNVNIVFEDTIGQGTTVSYDRIKLNQALINILKNAQEFSKPGDEVRVTLERESCHPEQSEGSSRNKKSQDSSVGQALSQNDALGQAFQRDILIKISDQGEGVPLENREKIFETYFTTRNKGTGIGLAQSRKIIEAHEGTLTIDPDKTDGTTFIIRLKGG